MASQGTWVLSRPHLFHGLVGLRLGHLPFFDCGGKPGRGMPQLDLSNRGVELGGVARGPNPDRFGFGDPAPCHHGVEALDQSCSPLHFLRILFHGF